LRQHRRRDRILVTSFRHDVVARCAEEIDVSCGFLLAHRPIDASAMFAAWCLPPQVRTIVWDFNVLDQETVAASKAFGLKTYAYGIATSDDYAQCRDWGLDGIIADDPPLVRGR
jgi:glycerophosphoryl diester phosphodiesterase